MEHSMAVPQKTKNRTTIWSSSPTPEYVSEENKNASLKTHRYPNVHSSIIYNSQDMEATQVSIKRWMNKENVHICNGILLSHKKELNYAICNNMDEPRENYA